MTHARAKQEQGVDILTQALLARAVNKILRDFWLGVT